MGSEKKTDKMVEYVASRIRTLADKHGRSAVLVVLPRRMYDPDRGGFVTSLTGQYWSISVNITYLDGAKANIGFRALADSTIKEIHDWIKGTRLQQKTA